MQQLATINIHSYPSTTIVIYRDTRTATYTVHVGESDTYQYGGEWTIGEILDDVDDRTEQVHEE